MYYLPSSAVGQQLVAATVHLAGPVETETGHVQHAGSTHISARLGGLLLSFLTLDAVAGFAWAAAELRDLAAGAFDEFTAPALPGDRERVEQSIGLAVRLSGAQDIGRATASTAAASLDGGPWAALRLGGLTVVVRDRIALQALMLMADTTERVAMQLWPSYEDVTVLPAGGTRPRLPRISRS